MSDIPDNSFMSLRDHLETDQEPTDSAAWMDLIAELVGCAVNSVTLS